LKKGDLLSRYITALEQGRSIRAAARATGISASTAFRWRHRLLAAIASKHREPLMGCVELLAERVPISRKGQRRLDRRARRRGPRPSSIRLPQASILIGLDRRMNLVTAAIPVSRPTARDLDEIFAEHLVGPPTVFAAEGRYGAASLMARRRGGRFRDVRRPEPHRPIEQIDAARAYSRQLEVWMTRFRGVATRYLDNYLAWHRALTYADRHRFEALALRWPAIDSQRFSRTESERKTKKEVLAAVRGAAPAEMAVAVFEITARLSAQGRASNPSGP
jgi:transposase-like protein